MKNSVVSSLSLNSLQKVDVPISIDTYKSAVAKKAIEAGAQIINDISGLHLDPSLSQVAAKEDVPLVLMHMRGNPETMQKNIIMNLFF
jgi:dihydropteroate synthase